MTKPNEIPTWETGMKQIAPDVYAYIQSRGSWFWSNAGLIVGRDYCIAVDSLATVGLTQTFIDEIKKVSDKPIRYLVNTHHHGDHIWANHLFSGAEIVCHKHCRDEALRTAAPEPSALSTTFPEFDFSGVKITPPDITFENKLTFHLDEGEVQLIYYKPGHTVGDIIVWLPQQSTVFAGDLLFLYSTPLAMQGSFAGWIEIMEALANLDARTYVPGHGPLCGKEGLLECRDYLVLVRDQARKRFDSGLSVYEAARDINLGHFKKWVNWERIVINVERLYREFGGEEPTSEIDLPALFGHMNELVASG